MKIDRPRSFRDWAATLFLLVILTLVLAVAAVNPIDNLSGLTKGNTQDDPEIVTAAYSDGVDIGYMAGRNAQACFINGTCPILDSYSEYEKWFSSKSNGKPFEKRTAAK